MLLAYPGTGYRAWSTWHVFVETSWTCLELEILLALEYKAWVVHRKVCFRDKNCYRLRVQIIHKLHLGDTLDEDAHLYERHAAFRLQGAGLVGALVDFCAQAAHLQQVVAQRRK